ncbi:MAG: hypothetical protein HRU09_10930 [Oligoflexales bacterium]|nr:hypothetical protein [Oligoflexales bacterium]
MKRTAALLITSSLLISSAQTSFAFKPESEFDRDYQTVKSVICSGLTIAAMAGLAAIGWGAMDYVQDYEEQGPEVADGLASVYRGAGHQGNRVSDKLKRKFARWGRSAANDIRRQRMSEEAKAIHKIPVVKKLCGIGYGYAPVVADKINELAEKPHCS